MIDATSAVNLAKEWQNVSSEVDFTGVNYNAGAVDVNQFIFDGNDLGRSSQVFVNESMNIETV